MTSPENSECGATCIEARVTTGLHINVIDDNLFTVVVCNKIVNILMFEKLWWTFNEAMVQSWPIVRLNGKHNECFT